MLQKFIKNFIYSFYISPANVLVKVAILKFIINMKIFRLVNIISVKQSCFTKIYANVFYRYTRARNYPRENILI